MNKSKKKFLYLFFVLMLFGIVTYIYFQLGGICKKPFTTDFNQAFKSQSESYFIAFDFMEKGEKLKGSFVLTEKDQAKTSVHNFIAKKIGNDSYEIRICFDGERYEGQFSGEISSNRINGSFIPDSDLTTLFNLEEKMISVDIKRQVYTKPQKTDRYQKQVFDSVVVRTGIHFGSAEGYYSEYIVDKNTEPDYGEVIKTVLKKLSKKSLNSFMSIFSDRFEDNQRQDLYMDIYEPYNDTLKARPLLVLIHGGAFLIGERQTETIKYLADKKAKEGYVVASIDYRMGFNPASPSSMERSAYRAVQDARAAMRYLVHYAGHFQIDTSELYVGGTSAGAITALNLAYMEDDQKFESTDGAWWRFQQDLDCIDCSTNDYKENFSVKGVINMWGAVHDTSIIDHQDQIPLISFHGDSDCIVPIDHNYPFANLDTSVTQYVLNKLYGSRPVHEQLSKFGVQNELHEFEGKDHEPQLGTESYFDNKVIEFISEESKNFLYKCLIPVAEIKDVSKGYNQIARYQAPAYPNAGYFWKVENGVIVNQNPKLNEVEVIWLEGKRRGKLDLTVVSAVGVVGDSELKQKLK